jgi:hypothetical protein
MTAHQTGTREEWLAARLELLEAEKELTRHSDEVAAKSREWLAQARETHDGWPLSSFPANLSSGVPALFFVVRQVTSKWLETRPSYERWTLNQRRTSQ